MDNNIEKILLGTSQSLKELKIINENITYLDKKISKIVFEEKKRIINKIYNKKYF
jgi:hypothetical protein